MPNFKNYFYNLKNYSDTEIKKFIHEQTNNLNPSLLISLNRDFIMMYLKELEELNESKASKDIDMLGNLLSEEEYEKNNTILCRNYSYSYEEKIFSVEEVFENFENLTIADHRQLGNKIYPFQFCLHKIITELGLKVIHTFNTTQIIKVPQNSAAGLPDGELEKNNHKNKSIYLGLAINKEAEHLFEYLVENYRADERTSVKFVNLLHYLKNDSNKEAYTFNVKQADFKKLISTKFGIDIKKFQKSELYKENELPLLNSKERDFLKYST